MLPSEVTVPKESASPQTILVVDDEPSLTELIADLARRHVTCTLRTAGSVQEARDILETEPVDLLITDVNLPDGDGTALIEMLQLHQPTASAMVITGAPSVDGAVSALRQGAVDFLPKPFTHEQLVDRLRNALGHQSKTARHQKRFDRLKVAVKRLNESRRVISKKVDLLCNDLVTAYGELSRQLDGVRTQENFRKYIASAVDLEQLLCHGMDWLMRQLGYSNVAVWLAADDGEFQLGAYMKYTIAGDALVTDAIKRVVLPAAVREGLVHTRGSDVGTAFTPQELHLLKDQEILAANCTYLGESLATIVFFRDARSPYSADDEATLKAVSPIFAVSLASIVRRADADGTGDAGAEPSGGPFLDGDDQNDFADPKDKPRKDAADWWKNGEDPPF